MGKRTIPSKVLIIQDKMSCKKVVNTANSFSLKGLDPIPEQLINLPVFQNESGRRYNTVNVLLIIIYFKWPKLMVTKVTRPLVIPRYIHPHKAANS